MQATYPFDTCAKERRAPHLAAVHRLVSRLACRSSSSSPPMASSSMKTHSFARWRAVPLPARPFSLHSPPRPGPKDVLDGSHGRSLRRRRRRVVVAGLESAGFHRGAHRLGAVRADRFGDGGQSHWIASHPCHPAFAHVDALTGHEEAGMLSPWRACAPRLVLLHARGGGAPRLVPVHVQGGGAPRLVLLRSLSGSWSGAIPSPLHFSTPPHTTYPHTRSRAPAWPSRACRSTL